MRIPSPSERGQFSSGESSSIGESSNRGPHYFILSNLRSRRVSTLLFVVSTVVIVYGYSLRLLASRPAFTANSAIKNIPITFLECIQDLMNVGKIV